MHLCYWPQGSIPLLFLLNLYCSFSNAVVLLGKSALKKSILYYKFILLYILFLLLKPFLNLYFSKRDSKLVASFSTEFELISINHTDFDRFF